MLVFHEFHLILSIVFGGLDPSFPISYRVCPVIQSYSSPNIIQKHSNEFQITLNKLLSQIEVSPLSPDSGDDIFYDALSYSHSSVGPKMVNSTADLQQLLPSHSQKVMGRANSTASLSKLHMRTKSNSNIVESKRASKSYNSLSSITRMKDRNIRHVRPISSSSDHEKEAVMHNNAHSLSKFTRIVKCSQVLLRWMKLPKIRNKILFIVVFIILKKVLLKKV